jgi:hypothetical protein
VGGAIEGEGPPFDLAGARVGTTMGAVEGGTACTTVGMIEGGGFRSAGSQGWHHRGSDRKGYDWHRHLSDPGGNQRRPH